MGRTNFTECALRNLPLNESMISVYGYNGTVERIPVNQSTQVTLHGCIALCGDGNDWYTWAQSSNTLTTWIFPILGVLLQAPFISNAFWQTSYSLARWVGSPIASLSYMLWNIKVSGKCALIVDMALPYKEPIPGRKSDYGSVRDSFYLLGAMNQFTMRPKVRQKKEAEGLLRVALFSKDLRLLRLEARQHEPILRESPNDSNLRHRNTAYVTTGPDDMQHDADAHLDLESDDYLNELRQDLAEEMRAGRKRGVVPVYISTVWFIFALALSIQTAFGVLGENAQAHDLALGCLLAWLPVLILCSIVDRNPVAADDIRNKLNNLVDRVRVSLMDDRIRAMYLETIDNRERQEQMRSWVGRISDECDSLQDFFVDFAGQGRLRWHYGCAHPIIRDIESAYIAKEGRDWLRSESEARTLLVLGDVLSGGLDWFDLRELWQIVGAFIIVVGTIAGAFTLSFFTPTVGLGCRSGGYVIFGVVASALLFAEIGIWWIIDAKKPDYVQMINRPWTRRSAIDGRRDSLFTNAAPTAAKATGGFESFLHGFSTILCRILPDSASEDVRDWFEALIRKWHDLDGQQLVDYILRLCEVANCSWLVYMTLAQTFGAFVNCRCMTSSWGLKRPYYDFNQYSTTNSPNVKVIWITGTSISVSVMGLAILYIVTEWCLQSHLSTANEKKAASGLRWVRRFRTLLIPLFIPLRWLPNKLKWGDSKSTLHWTRSTTCQNSQHNHDGVERSGSTWSAMDVPLLRLPREIEEAHERRSSSPSPRPSDITGYGEITQYHSYPIDEDLHSSF